MDKKMEEFVLDLLKSHKYLSLATLRTDGYPQANTVSYANNGLDLYFFSNAGAQKIENIRGCEKVSLTIDREYDDWTQIKGLSMAATAEILTAPEDIQNALGLLAQKFPALLEMPEPEEPPAVVKITPKIISVLNYELGISHTDLVGV